MNTLSPAPAKLVTPIEKLPFELQQLAKEHELMLKKEVEHLKQNYCVNQWKVQKE